MFLSNVLACPESHRPEDSGGVVKSNTCKTEVADLQLAIGIYKYVSRLEVPVKDVRCTVKKNTVTGLIPAGK